MNFLVDDRGEVWLAHGDELRRRLGNTESGFDLPDYAIRNLGFIQFADDPSGFRVRLRPRLVNPATLAGIIYALADIRPKRVVISHLAEPADSKEWRDEIAGSFNRTVARLSELVEERSPSVKRAFYMRGRKINEVASNQHGPLAALFHLWRGAEGKFYPDAYDDIFHRGLNNRYVIIAAHGNDEHIIGKEWGNGFVSYNQAWIKRAVGRRFDQQPDWEYGRWVAPAYREAAGLSTPRLDDIDATIISSDYVCQRVRYRRLILPCQIRKGTRILIGASIIDPTINLAC